MSKSTKKFIVVVLIIGIIYGVYTTVKIRSARNDLRASYKLTVGEVSECNKIPKLSEASIHYEFVSNGRQYVNSKKYSDIDKFKCNTLVGRKFLVAYEKGNVSNNEILINEQDYKMFNLEYPDSLFWVRKYFYPYN